MTFINQSVSVGLLINFMRLNNTRNVGHIKLEGNCW